MTTEELVDKIDKIYFQWQTPPMMTTKNKNERITALIKADRERYAKEFAEWCVKRWLGRELPYSPEYLITEFNKQEK